MFFQPKHPRYNVHGFTLVELMVTVAIIGILASIAYPAYMNYIKQARRADAQAGLSAIQLAEEKFKFSAGTYTANFTSMTTPTVSPDGYYNLSVSGTPTATGYTASAAAVTGTSQASDNGCTTITMTVTAGATASFSPANCIKK